MFEINNIKNNNVIFFIFYKLIFLKNNNEINKHININTNIFYLILFFLEISNNRGIFECENKI